MGINTAEAKKLIAEAKKNKSEKLEIIGLKSEKLPKEIGDLENLCELILESCDFNTLPCEIGNLKNLKSLSIINSKRLEHLPMELGDLYNLRYLNISKSRKRFELPKSIGKLKNLQELHISEAGIFELPVEINGLSSLNKLNMHDTCMEKLPNEIFEIINLEEIRVSGSRLDNIPIKIAGMKNLRSLNLYGNNIRYIPDEILNLVGLTKLILSRNKIEILPECISNLTSLKNLILLGNRLTELPDSLFNINTLEEFSLANNELEVLPLEIKKLVNLKTLDLSNNKLLKIPKEIFKLRKLENLDLRGNNINKIPRGLKKIKNLSIDPQSSYLEKMLIKNEHPYKALSHEIQQMRKKVWIPIVKNEETDIFSSKFGGIPYLGKNKKWPICDTCKKPLQFFMQINIEDISKVLQKEWNMDKGIIQFFYCINEETYSCEGENINKDAFGNNFLVRLIIADKEITSVSIPEEVNLYREKKIVKWKESYDYPHPWEILDNHIPLKINKTKYVPFDLLSLYSDIESEHILKALGKKILGINYELEDEEELTGELIVRYLQRPLSDEKIGGWPAWVQNIKYPLCPVCGKKMKYLIQINSDINIPYVFGDYGRGHISQCSEHKNIFGFKYSCY